MLMMRYIISIITLLVFQAWRIQSQCILKTELSGSIYDSSSTSNSYKKCWKIEVPDNHFIQIKISQFSTNYENCNYGYLQLSVNRSNEDYKYCKRIYTNNPLTAFSDVGITFYLDGQHRYSVSGNFRLSYEVEDIECIKSDSFHCTNYTCIPKAQVCDGVKDCENGADEVGCETGVTAIEGVAKARSKAIDWLISKRTAAWGWQENTARAVTALFLAGGANFNGSILEEELMAKQTELKVAVALLRDTVPLEQLGMYINSLLVTCHSPRRFHGNDLVKRLKDQLLSSGNFTHPAAYLALCNANETWPARANADLSSILSSNSKYPFVRDIKAFAIMALSCMTSRTKFLDKLENSNLKSLYQKNIRQFKQYQTSERSFGNAHTTALITQALFSNGDMNSKDWKLNVTIKYLMKTLNSTSVSFITTYLTLPVLNGKSLSDIAKVNCSANPRKHGDGDLVSELNDYLGPKIRVRYSLFVGDEKDVIHTISLRVPENFTAFEVMQLAEVEDSKYKFKWKRVSGQMYVYEIAKITNDPEAAKFWLMYTGSSNSTEEFVHSTSDPDQLLLSDGHHLIMWYKTAHI